jgi:uncharacterized membrane protein
MNPKGLNDLDPKLKETYERVMGTSLGEAPTAVAAPAPKMETQPITQPVISQPQPAAPAEMPTPSAVADSTVSQVFRADDKNTPAETATVNSPSSKSETPTKKSGNKLLPIIVIGALVFFAIYAVLWAKLLGLF